ncbi:MAG: class I SAM-dependent methyltransferase [Patescibacteria group bacterium]
MDNFLILKTESSGEYELLDSGEGEKLERYGEFILSRPDPQALWKKTKQEMEWKKASGIFSRDARNAKWITKNNLPEKWNIEIDGLRFWIHLGAFKHTGVFPEQASNWKWIEDQIKKSKKKVSVLNLFGYTGGATLAAARAGAEVCHLDGSKVAINWAKENAELSDLKDAPIRWILDDAVKFLKREIKRGNKYDGIIMDPPAFGHGPGGELWKIEDDLIPLFDLCKEVLSSDPVFFLVNGYASGYSATAYKNNLANIMEKYGGEIEIGELTIEESKAKRLLPCGIFARWSK